jgi:hypothetical protein
MVSCQAPMAINAMVQPLQQCCSTPHQLHSAGHIEQTTAPCSDHTRTKLGSSSWQAKGSTLQYCINMEGNEGGREPPSTARDTCQ